LILDTSAVVAVIREEGGASGLMDAIEAAQSVAIGAPTLFETAMVLIVREGEAAGRSFLSLFLEENGIVSIPFDDRHRNLALDAFLRYGKGRHPAKLNLGDCMTYATARLADQPLLCIGNDFAKTDLWLASI
jgi:ribonuclease VapC